MTPNYALTLEYLESSFYNEATRAGKVTEDPHSGQADRIHQGLTDEL